MKTANSVIKLTVLVVLLITASFGVFLYSNHSEYEACESKGNHQKALYDLGISEEKYTPKNCNSVFNTIKDKFNAIFGEPEIFNVEGFLTVSHFGNSSCRNHPYRDIRDEAVVQVRAPNDELLSTATLNQFNENITGCYYRFEVKIPEGEEFYVFHIGNRKTNISDSVLKEGFIEINIGR